MAEPRTQRQGKGVTGQESRRDVMKNSEGERSRTSFCSPAAIDLGGVPVQTITTPAVPD